MTKKALSILGIISIPGVAFAANGVTVQSIVDAAVMTALYVASGITVVLWIYAGILFLSAQGDPGKVTKAKGSVLTAVAGTVLVIIAASAIAIVKSALHI